MSQNTWYLKLLYCATVIVSRVIIKVSNHITGSVCVVQHVFIILIICELSNYDY